MQAEKVISNPSPKAPTPLTTTCKTLFEEGRGAILILTKLYLNTNAAKFKGTTSAIYLFTNGGLYFRHVH